MNLTHLDRILSDKDNYLLCEKSDGVRFIMLVLSNGYCILTGRYQRGNKYVFFLINSDIYVPSKNTEMKVDYAFDGELISSNDNEFQFLIFDSLYQNDTLVAHKSYQERL